ncbi:TIGR03086 family metal-binding protein [Actinomadura harenae]|uniref:TIGR03086 family protein n=1 Tax=Actinomadura harenae TaxID=2483351 RepID=A0A3M2MBU6_9ACTN|nr:TIGR03086 family metal-binding protein [Actinomadura harenae]RMI47077.1 TIGR03086 family protein [Actinomadura harenae]
MDVLTELLSSDFRDLDRRALAFFASLTTTIKPADLARPTPCPDWTLHGLLRHQVGQDEGFAAAARGEGDALAAWRGGSLGDDPHAAVVASGRLVTGAFADDAVLDREFALPEVRDGGLYPARLAITFHVVDLVVHAWDVAAALGLPWEPDDELVEASLKVAAIVPDDAASRAPGESFAPSLPSAGRGGRERLLTLLGRDPAWRPAV